MIQPGAWVFAIDFGTTNTVASVADVAGVRTLTVDAKPSMPSAVLLLEDEAGARTWQVGDPAINGAFQRMEWFEASPKSSIQDKTLFLGGQDVPVGDAIAAVMTVLRRRPSCRTRTVRRRRLSLPTRQCGEKVVFRSSKRPPGPRLRACEAGRIHPVAEPVAAAQRVLDIVTIPLQTRIVVLDLGGGTADVAVVDRSGDILRITGKPLGRDGIAGEDFDLRLARWMTAEAGAPQLYDRLVASDDPEERERAVDIRFRARLVKEQLSRQAVVPAALPKSPPSSPRKCPFR